MLEKRGITRWKKKELQEREQEQGWDQEEDDEEGKTCEGEHRCF